MFAFKIQRNHTSFLLSKVSKGVDDNSENDVQNDDDHQEEEKQVKHHPG